MRRQVQGGILLPTAEAQTPLPASVLYDARLREPRGRAIGSKYLHRHNLNLTKITADSFTYYFTHGAKYTSPGKTVGEAMLSLDTKINGDDTLIGLPVCVPKYVNMGDLNDKGVEAKFPFSCGDWTGNETQQLQARLYLARGQKDFDTKMTYDLFEKTSKQPRPFLSTYTSSGMLHRRIEFLQGRNSTMPCLHLSTHVMIRQY
jgi:hypothetical protein